MSTSIQSEYFIYLLIPVLCVCVLGANKNCFNKFLHWILEHTEENKLQIAFTQMHTFCVLVGKNCVNRHKFCENYTNPGQ
jgi:hypothetical protein